MRLNEMSRPVRFQGRVQKQTYRENDYLLCYVLRLPTGDYKSPAQSIPDESYVHHLIHYLHLFC